MVQDQQHVYMIPTNFYATQSNFLMYHVEIA